MTTTLKKKGLLSGGLFDKPFMDSRATTNSVSTKEWVLGHLIGPLGLIFVVNTIAALVEKFFTQQTGAMYGVENVEMIRQMGGWYEIVMTVAKVLAMGIGLLNGWLIQNTESKQGRMRPWHLIFGFVSIIIGCLIFLFPGNSMVAQLCRRSWNLMDAKTLSMILGHASVAFTLDTYAHVLTDHKIEEMKRMQAVFNQAQFAQAIQPLSQNIPNS